MAQRSPPGKAGRRGAGQGVSEAAPHADARFPVITWTTDTDLRLTSYFHEALVALGADLKRFQRLSVSEHFRGHENAELIISAHQRALAGEPASFELRAGRRLYGVRVQPLIGPSGEVVGCAGVAVDSSESEEERARLARAKELSEALGSLLRESLSLEYDEGLFKRFIDLAVSVVPGAQAGSVWLRSGSGDEFTVEAAAGFAIDAYRGVVFTEEEMASGTDPAERFPVGLAELESARPEIVAQLRQAGPIDSIGSTIGAPITVAGRTAAYLYLHNMVSQEPFSAEAWEVARTLAEQLGALVQRAELEKQLRNEKAYVERLLGEYRELAAFSANIEIVQDTGELIDRGMHRLLRAFSFDVAILTNVTDEGAFVERTLGIADEDAGGLLEGGIPVDAGAARLAISTRTLQFIEDYQAWPAGLELFKRAGLRSLLTLPVTYAGRVRHLILFATLSSTVNLAPENLQVADSFVRRLQNAFDRVQHLNEISATREATFRSLGLALEYRDLETYGHTDRVVSLSRRFGKKLGLPRSDLQALTWGAYLHDIGKLSVPDRILLKPGRLTEAEFEIMKRHTIHGLELTRDIPFLPVATREVIRNHHEKWNGGGYPDSLAGDSIPLLARIFTLVDVYDALTSDRPYRKAWTHDAAVAELVLQSGSQFDPALVKVFLDLIE